MNIYGFLVRLWDYTTDRSMSTYGFVVSNTLSVATAKIEESYDSHPFVVEEITIQKIDDVTDIIAEDEINFFIDSAKQNSFGNEGN